MNPEDITGAGLPDASQLNAADPKPTVEPVAPTPEMTLAELNKHLGKNFPTKEAAFKALSDTFSYVGKKKEDIEKEVKATIAVTDKTEALAKELGAIRKDMFFKDNPAYAPYRGLIEKLGGNPAEVVSTAEFKEVFTKASGYDEVQSKRTVLDSNPRLAATKDKISKAKEAQAKGELQGEALENAVVGAYLESLGN